MVSFVIVNYNGEEFIDKCIQSILCLNVDKEIIVVDNCSTDNSISLILKYQVKVYVLKKNAGYATALNLGIKHSEGDYLFLLTPTTFLNNNIDFDKLKKYDVCSIKLKDIKGSTINSVRKIPNILDVLFLLTGISEIFYKSHFFNRWRNPDFDYEKEGIAEQPMSCALFVKKEVFEKIGFFDERFFIYFSDVDFSRRLKKNNIKTYYIPDFKAFHIRGGITYKLGLKRLYFYYKDFSKYIYKYHKIFYPIFIPLMLLVFFLSQVALSLKYKTKKKIRF